MQYRAMLIMAMLAQAAGAVLAADGEQQGSNAAWQPREARFYYTGYTSIYTCDGLRDQVRRILEYVGARKGPWVRVSGCPEGAHVPSRMLNVEMEFAVLEDGTAGKPPVGNNSSGKRIKGRFVANAEAPVVESSWQEFKLAPRSPSTLGEGECELVEAMQKVLTENFAVSDMEVRTSCVPHQIGHNDYTIRGKVLRPAKIAGK